MWRRPLGLAVAVGLGVVAGLILNGLEPGQPTTAPTEVAAPQVDPQVLAAVEALRDEARALTVAEVALDERAHERWMPRVAKIEVALDDPETPDPIRKELLATITALECVGVLEPSIAGQTRATCATITR